MVRRANCPRKGFTLVELLVVIGIIALLISILLPALGKARKAANTVKCMANLRSITQGMQIYAAQNNGAIPGSPFTTAQFVYQPGGQEKEVMMPGFTVAANSKNYPTVVSTFDWMTPIARIMGTKFTDAEEAATDPGRVARWVRVSSMSAFQCPENQFLATPFTSSTTPANVPVGPMVSYVAAAGFLLGNNPVGNPPTKTSAFEVGTKFSNPPTGYVPKVTKVGKPSKKIFVADGAKFTNGTSAGPTTSLNFGSSTSGGLCVDEGAWTLFSNSWDRGLAPGNSPSSTHTPSTVDARTFAYRHGQVKQRGAADSFRFNAAFYDGHVETLGDLEGSNPTFWYPKGSYMQIDLTECGQDVIKAFFNGTPPPAPYYLPE